MWIGRGLVIVGGGGRRVIEGWEVWISSLIVSDGQDRGS